MIKSVSGKANFPKGKRCLKGTHLLLKAGISALVKKESYK